MNAERARTFILTLPHVVETMQWGDNLIFWLGDKAIGGRMFTLIPLDPVQGGVIKGVASYLAGAGRFAERIEQDGLIPAPYFARILWVAAQSWAVLRDAEWEEEFRHAHRLTFEKLPPKTRALLTLPPAELKRAIAARKRLLAARERTRPKTPPKKTPARRTKATEATDLAVAAKAARPKKHRQR